VSPANTNTAAVLPVLLDVTITVETPNRPAIFVCDCLLFNVAPLPAANDIAAVLFCIIEQLNPDISELGNVIIAAAVVDVVVIIVPVSAVASVIAVLDFATTLPLNADISSLSDTTTLLPCVTPAVPFVLIRVLSEVEPIKPRLALAPLESDAPVPPSATGKSVPPVTIIVPVMSCKVATLSDAIDAGDMIVTLLVPLSVSSAKSNDAGAVELAELKVIPSSLVSSAVRKLAVVASNTVPSTFARIDSDITLVLTPRQDIVKGFLAFYNGSFRFW